MSHTSPFRSRSLGSSKATSSGKSPKTPNRLPPGETPCPRHPRSWVEKKVFFMTKTRQCPHCELESYAIDPENPDAPLPPCEPGFGGFAPPEPKRRRNPRAAAGQRRAPTPRSRGSGGTGTPRGGIPRGTPHQRSSTPRSAMVVRRTAVFNADGGTPRNDTQGRKMPRHAAKTPSPTRARRNPRTPRRHSFSTSSPISTLTPTSSHKRPGGIGGGVMSPNSNSAALHASSPSKPPGVVPPLHPVGDSTPIRQGKSLMFTSMARRRAKDGTSTPKGSSVSTTAGSSAGAGSPGNSGGRARAGAGSGVFRPPSPSGSVFSDLSAAGSSLAIRRRGSSVSGSVVLDLPQAVIKDGGGGGGGQGGREGGRGEQAVPLSPISMARGNLPAPSSHAGDAAASVVRLVEVDRGNGGARTPVPRLRSILTSGVAAAAATAGSCKSSLEAMVSPGVAERAEAAAEVASEKIRPLTTVVAELSDAIRALRPQVVVELAGDCIDEVLGTVEIASAAIRRARVSTKEEGSGGGGGGDDDEEDEAVFDVDEEEVEAAGAILVEASDAMEALVQTARALVWSGQEPRNLGASPSFVERHGTAEAAIGEAAHRAKLLLGRLIAVGKTPGGGRVVPDAAVAAAAAVEREWFAVVDRHEAWMGRRDSRKGLLMAEQEIPSEAVTVFRDCPLLPEGSLGRTYLAEYLGEPVAATLLERRGGSANAIPVDGGRVATSLSVIASSELRALASLLPAHPRLARTHGSEVTPPQGFHSSAGGGRGGDGVAGMGEGDGDGVGVCDGRVFLVLVGELVEGGCLRDRVAASAGIGAGPGATAFSASEGREGGGVCGGERVGSNVLRRRQVLADIAEGLAFLHERGVVHGALSSENVLLDARGRAKLSLFGLIETRKAVAAAMLNASTGPPNGLGYNVWTPPEALSMVDIAGGDAAGGDQGMAIIMREREAGIAADAFAFGMIAWEVLTGERPWAGISADEIFYRVCHGERPPLPVNSVSLDGFAGFGDMLRMLWAQDPTARPTLGEVARNLRVRNAPQSEPLVLTLRNVVAGTEVFMVPGAGVIDAGGSFAEPEGGRGCGDNRDGDGYGNDYGTEGLGNPAGNSGARRDASGAWERVDVAANALPSNARGNDDGVHELEAERVLEESATAAAAAVAVAVVGDKVVEMSRVTDHRVTTDAAESESTAGRALMDHVSATKEESRRCSHDVEEFIISSGSSSSSSSSSSSCDVGGGGRDMAQATECQTPTASDSMTVVVTADTSQGKVSWADEEEVVHEGVGGDVTSQAFHRPPPPPVPGTPLLSSSPLLSTDTTPRAVESEEVEEDEDEEEAIMASEPLPEGLDDMPALVSMSTIMSLSDEEDEEEEAGGTSEKEENASREYTPLAEMEIGVEEEAVIQRSTSSEEIATTGTPVTDEAGSSEEESGEKSQASSGPQQVTKAHLPNQQHQQQHPPPLPLFSPDLSQLSDNSKVSATVVVTPPTGVHIAAAVAAAPAMKTKAASPSPVQQKQHQQPYAVAAASSQAKQAADAEPELVSTGVARAESASSTPGRRGRAGAALRGIASSLVARLGKKKKGSGEGTAKSTMA